MKKMSNKGFTLIELLAVITIMGILMMVAIPAVTRTIENSRRDTFVDTIGEYVNAIRNGMLADNIECYNDSTKEWAIASASPAGTYYFPICTSSSFCDVTKETYPATGKNTLDNNVIENSTINIMEQGGKSPFGNAEIRGYIKFIKTDSGYEESSTASPTASASSSTSPSASPSTGSDKDRVKYYAYVADSGKHGMVTEEESSKITRTKITTDTKDKYKAEVPAGGNLCTLR